MIGNSIFKCFPAERVAPRKLNSLKLGVEMAGFVLAFNKQWIKYIDP